MTKPGVYPVVYTVEEFARFFKLSAEAVRNLIRRGEIPAIRIGKQYRISEAVVDLYFARALPPEERGFAMWKRKPVASLAYVNRLRDQDRRAPEVFLKDMEAEDG